MGVGGTVLGAGLLGTLAGCGGSDDEGSASAGAASRAGKTLALSLNGFNTYDQDTAEGS